MFYTPCVIGGRSIYILCTHCFIFFFSSSAILLYHFVITSLCTTLKFSDHVVMFSPTLLSPNSLLFQSIVRPPQLLTHHLGRKTRVSSHLTDVATLVTADYRPWISCYPWSPGPEDAECTFCSCCLSPGNTWTLHVFWARGFCPHMVILRAFNRLCDTAEHPS